MQTRSGIPAGRQCLVYSGKQLDDSRMLPSYGIGEGSTLQMLLRLRGGVPIKVIQDATKPVCLPAYVTYSSIKTPSSFSSNVITLHACVNKNHLGCSLSPDVCCSSGLVRFSASIHFCVFSTSHTTLQRADKSINKPTKRNSMYAHVLYGTGGSS